MVNELNKETFKKNTSKGNVVVDFYADWCGPCQLMKPVFEKLSTEFPKVSFFKVNVDKNPDSPIEYDVRSIPTFVLLKDGKEIDRLVGIVSETDLRKKLKAVYNM